MRLRKVKYSEFEGTPQEWTLEGLLLGQANLIVGKNASGKSRTLNIIRALAKHLAGIDSPRLSGNFDFEFIEDEKIINYQLNYHNEEVITERYSIDGKLLLERTKGNIGRIFAEDIEGGTDIRFQIPDSEIAAVVRQDAIQHKFLEPLHIWGTSLRYYAFGTPLGQNHFGVLIDSGNRKADENDPHDVIALFRQAEHEFKDEFSQLLKDDMRRIDYDLEDFGLKSPISIRVSGMPGPIVGLYVKEKDLPGITDQNSMSQGMFRAFSLLAQINYSLLAGKSTCILIDDIGEGLDFDRSCRLIDLLHEKAKNSDIQLVLSTNDRFVMNRVPLEEWSVLQRNRNHVHVLNQENSKDLFDDFQFTGLSNFDFLTTEFYLGGFDQE